MKNKPIPAGPPVIVNCSVFPNSSIKPGTPRLEYRNKRKKQLLEIDKIQNNLGSGDQVIELLKAFMSFRHRANRLI